MFFFLSKQFDRRQLFDGWRHNVHTNRATCGCSWWKRSHLLDLHPYDSVIFACASDFFFVLSCFALDEWYVPLALPHKRFIGCHQPTGSILPFVVPGAGTVTITALGADGWGIAIHLCDIFLIELLVVEPVHSAASIQLAKERWCKVHHKKWSKKIFTRRCADAVISVDADDMLQILVGAVGGTAAGGAGQ